jgi:hypothetical protein
MLSQQLCQQWYPRHRQERFQQQPPQLDQDNCLALQECSWHQACHALSALQARHPIAAPILAHHVLLDLTQDPFLVAAPCAPLVSLQLWAPLARLACLVPTLRCLDLPPALHVPVANFLALVHSPALCALPDSKSCRSVSRPHVWPSPTAT